MPFLGSSRRVRRVSSVVFVRAAETQADQMAPLRCIALYLFNMDVQSVHVSTLRESYSV